MKKELLDVKTCYFCGYEQEEESNEVMFYCHKCKKLIKKRSNPKQYYVYLLKCRNDAIYTGITTEVERRIEEHKKGNGSKYVAKKGVKKLLAVWICENRSEASKLEYRIKQMSHIEKRQLAIKWNIRDTKNPIRESEKP